MIPSLSSTPVVPVTPSGGTPAGVAPAEAPESAAAGSIASRAPETATTDGGESGAPRVDPAANPSGLDDQQLQQLQQLKARDREVRAHEAAHQAVGGRYAGAVSYTFQRGPDGNQYAIGGEVSIDISPVQGDPQATIEKMRIVKAAALAPAQPSAQDRAVAAQATQLLLQAQAELAMQAGAAEAAPDGDETSAEPSSAIVAYRSVAANAAGEASADRSVFQATA